MLEPEHGSSIDFALGSDVRNSPLAKNLFEVDGCIRVFFGSEFISVTKSDEAEWDHMKPHIFATIMDFYAEGKPAILEASELRGSDTTITDDDDEVVAMIKELLETRIRPAVQEDGGDIFYHGFNESSGIVSLQLAGSCAGCPSSSVTLKNGVENMLMHYIPEVKGILQLLDEDVKQQAEA